MQKDFTPVTSTQKSHYQGVPVPAPAKMEPSDTTLNKILQYAASYRVEKISNDQLVEYFLN